MNTESIIVAVIGRFVDKNQSKHTISYFSSNETISSFMGYQYINVLINIKLYTLIIDYCSQNFTCCVY